MKFVVIISSLLILVSGYCEAQNTSPCDHHEYFKDLGNAKLDTIRVNGKLVDPIDDSQSFKKVKYGFVTKGSRLFKKSQTYERCNGKRMEVEYFQEFTGRIDLDSYKEFEGRYFATKGRVYFWWVNSEAQLMIPVDKADPESFQPFEGMCGGTDDHGVYYGCPNRGVYKLDISVDSKYEFVPKEGNYWNSPNHYVIIDSKVYDIKHKYEKGYYIELDKTKSVDDVKKK